MTQSINGSADAESPDAIRYRLGNADWGAFAKSGVTLDAIFAAAEGWKARLDGVERPWLCWNVDDAWCRVQQRMVLEAGWTPLVGFDPRAGAPSLEPGAVLIDFNESFGLPTMWPHFPMEFAFLFTDRLAFWHADLLLRREKMRKLAAMFAALPDGTMAAVAPSRWNWRAFVKPREQRYWELVGCTTKGASRSQFEQGAGWWMRFNLHPSNSPAEQALRGKYYWDCGTGIHYWATRLGGKVTDIDAAYVEEGHCTGINRPDYKRVGPKNWTRGPDEGAVAEQRPRGGLCPARPERPAVTLAPRPGRPGR